MPSLRTLAILAPQRAAQATRLYTTTPAARLPYKNAQDKDSLNPRSTENTVSGRDDDAAALDDAAYNRNKTRPETAARTADAESKDGNPLNASGANQELSKPQGDERTPHTKGAGDEVSSGGASRRGGAQKGSKPGKV